MTVIPHPPYSPNPAPCDFFLFPKLKLRMKGWRFNTRIAAGTWHNSKKGLPGMLPSMAETLGPLYSCKRGVLWRWWRNLTSKLSKLLFTTTVLELLDTSLYVFTRGVQLKSVLQHAGTWWAAAWLPHDLCCHPAAFFCTLHPVLLSFLWGKLKCTFVAVTAIL